MKLSKEIQTDRCNSQDAGLVDVYFCVFMIFFKYFDNKLQNRIT